MTVLTCLPCSIKREIKQALNVPVSQLKHSEKPNNVATCQTFTKEEKRKISVSCQQNNLHKNDYYLDRASYKSSNLQYNNLPLSTTKFAVPIPIYILHEKYLI